MQNCTETAKPKLNHDIVSALYANVMFYTDKGHFWVQTKGIYFSFGSNLFLFFNRYILISTKAQGNNYSK